MNAERKTAVDEHKGGRQKLLVPLLLIFTAIAILATAFFCFPIPHTQRLVLACDGKTLVTLPIEPGESFTVDYIHSLNKSPVTDTIEWTGETFIVRTSYYKTFGAGIPVPAEDEGTTLTKVGDGFLLTNIDRELATILIFTDEIPDHHITLRNASYSLLDMVGIWQYVELSVRNVTLYELIAR